MTTFDVNKTPKKFALSLQMDLSKFEKATDEEKKQQYEAALQKAENEYPITTRFYDKETRESYEFRIIQIETEFGLYEPETTSST